MSNVQTDLKEVKLFIDGEYVASSSNSIFEVKNPATQEVIAHVHEASEEDVDRACKAARRAFEEGPWLTTSGGRTLQENPSNG